MVADALTFLKLDGSRAMTGDLNIGAKSLMTTNLALRELFSYSLGIKSNGSDMDLQLRYLRPTSGIISSSASNMVIQGKFNTLNSAVTLRSNNGAAYIDHLQFKAGAMSLLTELDGNGQDLVDLGSVILLAGKTVDCRNANARLRLPRATAGASTGGCRYDAATDTFEIYDGAVWNAH